MSTLMEIQEAVGKLPPSEKTALIAGVLCESSHSESAVFSLAGGSGA